MWVSVEVIRKIHGGWGVGKMKKEKRLRVWKFDSEIVNKWFEKVNQLATYKSGERESQIDFLMCKSFQLKDIRNAKVINGKSVAAQHRLVVLDWVMKSVKKCSLTQVSWKIKWWRLKEESMKHKFQEKVLKEAELPEGVNEWWEHNSNVIKKVGEEVLERTSGRKLAGDKEMWWWSNSVQKVVKAKKDEVRKWDKSGRHEAKESYM